jgi:hypothetical protein
METKKCKTCCEIKSIEEFPSPVYGVCKECRNNKRRDDRKKQTSLNLTLYDSKQKLNSYFEAFENHRLTIDEMIEHIIEVHHEAVRVKEQDVLLAFEYSLHPEICKYLDICYEEEERINQDRVHGRVYDRTYSAEYFKYHGLSQDTLIKNAHFITYLFDTMNGIKESYNFFIEDYNFAKKRNMNFVKMQDVYVKYNVNTNCIELSKNPLGLNPKIFFTKVKHETGDQHTIKAFHEMKKFDMFYEQYGIQ